MILTTPSNSTCLTPMLDGEYLSRSDQEGSCASEVEGGRLSSLGVVIVEVWRDACSAMVGQSGSMMATVETLRYGRKVSE